MDGHTSAAPCRAVPWRRGHMDRRDDDSSGYPIRLDVRAVRARGRTIQAWPAGCGLRWVVLANLCGTRTRTAGGAPAVMELCAL